jgi:hypothetical protein
MYTGLALTFIFVVSFFPSLYSQVDPEAIGYYNDALRFSSFGPYGTARFQAMGGVNAALGADLSSLAGNPAGLGFYNRSEVSLSLAFGLGGTNSTYSLDNARTGDSRSFFNFPNLGVVFNIKKNSDEESSYQGSSFGLGLTRMSNFQNRFEYSGMNNQNSMNDFFLELANGTPKYILDEESGNIQTLEGLAYFTFLINPYNKSDPNNTQYFSYDYGLPSKQEETVLTRGAINQWNLTYGTNFNDKLYLGASLGLPQVRYLSEKSFRETIIGGDTLNNFRFNESLKVKGGGINFKVGAIVKLAERIRVGGSIQTPTYYTLNEEFLYYIKSSFKKDPVSPSGFLSHMEESTNPGIYKYNLIAPMRIAAGLSLFAGKSGFIAVDIEYVPYHTARLKESSTYATAGNSTFNGDNRTIGNLYKGVINFNVGGELRMDVYRFRAGFSNQRDPYNIADIDRKVINISAGAGIRLDDYYLDLAVINTRFNSSYRPYTLSSGEEPVVNVKNKANNIIITAGVFF